MKLASVYARLASKRTITGAWTQWIVDKKNSPLIKDFLP